MLVFEMIHWTIHLKGGHENHYHADVVVGHKLYSFAGSRSILNNRDQIEVWVFNTVSLRWRKLPILANGRGEHLEVPCVHDGSTAVLVEDIIFLWGGYPYCNVLYSFDIDNHKWSKPNVSRMVPKPRYHHSACVRSYLFMEENPS